MNEPVSLSIAAPHNPVLGAISSAWALFIGVALIMLANGLQGTLLGLRATMEGFPTLATGVVMSGYFVGIFCGSLVAPRLVRRVGHIRVFAALASLASIAILVHGVWVAPLPWFAIRVVTGFSYAGLYIVAESWLNDCASNDTRGSLLGLYALVVLAGMGGGQALLNLADPGGMQLFVLTSVLISLALVPMLLTVRPAPRFEITTGISIRSLYTITPLGVFAIGAVGVAHGGLVGMGPVYANMVGLDVAGVSWFIGLIMAGGMLFNWPIGRLSDRFDRRTVLVAVAFCATLTAVAGWLFIPPGGAGMFVVIFLMGGFSLPIYSLTIAHANDHLAPEQMTAASGALVMTTGFGLMIGPIIASGSMHYVGPQGFYFCMIGAHLAIGLFGLYRMTRRAAMPAEEQASYVPTAPRGSQIGVAAAGEAMNETLGEHGDQAMSDSMAEGH